MNNMISSYDVLSRKPADVNLVARPFTDPEYRNVSKYWFAENAVLSVAMTVFSIYIPRGEKFFIKSVRYFENDIHDKELRELIRLFIKQEANHYKAHDVFNHGLEQKNMRSLREEKAAEKLFTFMEKWLPKKIQLGITVFDEHITATGAKVLLESKELVQSLEPEMRTLWEWHAVEEIEHKSVAFDVYEAMGAGYVHRIFSALLGIVIQGVMLVASENRLMKEEGVKRFGSEGKKAVRLLRKFTDFRRVARDFLLYFKPGFHPWDIDDRALIEAWYEKNNKVSKQQ
jgi:uncharacterized protein